MLKIYAPLVVFESKQNIEMVAVLSYLPLHGSKLLDKCLFDDRSIVLACHLDEEVGEPVLLILKQLQNFGLQDLHERFYHTDLFCFSPIQGSPIGFRDIRIAIHNVFVAGVVLEKPSREGSYASLRRCSLRRSRCSTFGGVGLRKKS